MTAAEKLAAFRARVARLTPAVRFEPTQTRVSRARWVESKTRIVVIAAPADRDQIERTARASGAEVRCTDDRMIVSF